MPRTKSMQDRREQHCDARHCHCTAPSLGYPSAMTVTEQAQSEP